MRSFINFHPSPNVIRVIKWKMRLAEHVARMEEMGNVYTILVARPEGKRSVGRLRPIWEDNIKVDLK